MCGSMPLLVTATLFNIMSLCFEKKKSDLSKGRTPSTILGLIYIPIAVFALNIKKYVRRFSKCHIIQSHVL